MNKFLWLSFFAILFCSCSVQRVNRYQKPHWADEFDSNVIDTTKWSKIPRGSADWNRHMSYADSCYEVKNGYLVLRGFRNYNSNDTAKYVTGGVFGLDKMAFGYGRIEVRAKLGVAKGAWPAFWFLTQGKNWPQGGEIDLMERLNHDDFVYQTIHTDYTLKLKIKDNPKSSATAKINPRKFNTYALEKYPDSLVFFVNGKRTFAYPRIQTDKEGQFPFANEQHYLLLDMQLGGNWVGAIEDKQLPVEMKIDWVRYYRFDNR